MGRLMRGGGVAAGGGENRFDGSARTVVQVQHAETIAVEARPSLIPWQVPASLVALADREAQRHRLRALAEDRTQVSGCRLVVVSGLPGVGKTELVRWFAHNSRELFPNGQLHVDLRGFDRNKPLTSGEALRKLLAGLVGESRVPVDEDDCGRLYQSAMADSRRLVLLDNARGVEQIAPLLPAEPQCLVVVTTRTRLRDLHSVEGTSTMPIEVLLLDDAVDLMIALIGETRRNDTREDLEDLAAECEMLPMALQIVSRKLLDEPDTPISEFISEIRQSASPLDIGDTEDGHNSLRAIISWSYAALPPECAGLFRLLPAHPGRCFDAASVAVLAGSDIRTARRLLAKLAEAGLLQDVPGYRTARYEIHHLMHAYAQDLPDGADGPAFARAATLGLANWYAAAVAAASRAMGTDSFDSALANSAPADAAVPVFDGYLAAREWFDAERPALAEAVTRSAAAGAHATTLALASALFGVYEVHGAFDDWITTSQQGLSAALALADRHGEAVMRESLGKACIQTHRLQAAGQYLRESLEIREEIGDAVGVRRTINAQGLLYFREGRLDTARDAFENVLGLAAAAGDNDFQAFALMNLGRVAVDTGAFQSGVARLTAALELLRAAGAHAYEINAMYDLAAALRMLGSREEARTAAERSVQLARQLENPTFLPEALLELARIDFDDGEVATAITRCEEVIGIQDGLGDLARLATAVDLKGEMLLADGDADRSAQCHRFAVETFRRLSDDERRLRSEEHLAVAEAAQEG